MTVTTGRIWNLPDASIRPKVVSSLWRIFFEGLARFARGRCRLCTWTSRQCFGNTTCCFAIRPTEAWELFGADSGPQLGAQSGPFSVQNYLKRIQVHEITCATCRGVSTTTTAASPFWSGFWSGDPSLVCPFINSDIGQKRTYNKMIAF